MWHNILDERTHTNTQSPITLEWQIILLTVFFYCLSKSVKSQENFVREKKHEKSISFLL